MSKCKNLICGVEKQTSHRCNNAWDKDLKHIAVCCPMKKYLNTEEVNSIGPLCQLKATQQNRLATHWKYCDLRT